MAISNPQVSDYVRHGGDLPEGWDRAGRILAVQDDASGDKVVTVLFDSGQEQDILASELDYPADVAAEYALRDAEAVTGISDERIAEIKARLDEWDERHRAHVANGEIGCGCNPYQDVIYSLPEYDPEDPRNLAIPEQLDEYVLSDGTVIDGERAGWRISRAARA